MSRKGLSHLISDGVGTGNSEVISIGVGEKIVVLGDCGDKKVEYGRGYTCAPRDPYPGMKRGVKGKIVSATGCSPF